MKELETIQRVIELIARGIQTAEALANFCTWLSRDPEEAAKVARDRATHMASGQAAYDAAKNAGPRR